MWSGVFGLSLDGVEKSAERQWISSQWWEGEARSFIQILQQRWCCFNKGEKPEARVFVMIVREHTRFFSCPHVSMKSGLSFQTNVYAGVYVHSVARLHPGCTSTCTAVESKLVIYSKPWSIYTRVPSVASSRNEHSSFSLQRITNHFCSFLPTRAPLIAYEKYASQ